MMNFKDILLKHCQNYPLMDPIDALKLAYQNEFGPAHMVMDPKSAAERVQKERELISERDVPPCISIGNGLCRLDLSSKELSSLPSTVIARMFAITASEIHGSKESFLQKIEIIRRLAAENSLPFTSENFEHCLSEYAKANYPAVSHSIRYKDAYKPSYRVIKESYAQILPVLTAIENTLNGAQNTPVLVAIDGHASAGKTTLAEQISAVYDCNVFHMDDFFLPPALRTEKRLGEAGGNVHYERFLEEVIEPLKKGVDFSYGVFDCSNMAINGNRFIETKKLNIIEGSYSHHPNFGEAYNLRIFMEISPEEQMKRILKRNGKELSEKFRNVWIPMENKYFEHFAIKEKSDLVFSTRISWDDM